MCEGETRSIMWKRLHNGCLDVDASAWDETYSNLQRIVRAMAGRRGMSWQDAEEITQTVALTYFRKKMKVRAPEALGGFLITLSDRAMKALWTKNRRKPTEELPSNEDQNCPQSGLYGENESSREEDQEDLRFFLEKCRASLTNRLEIELFDAFRAGESYESFASRMGISIGSIGPTRARMMKHIRETLGVTPRESKRKRKNVTTID